MDKDLLSIVDSSLSDPMIYRHIHIVNCGEATDEVVRKFKEGIKVFYNYINRDSVFREGFRKYLDSGGLKSFLEFRM